MRKGASPEPLKETMPALILELKQGESLLLRGAVIRFKTRARMELSTQERFLFGKQVMAGDEAVTWARKLYYALQQAYIGLDGASDDALAEARALLAAQLPAAPPEISQALAALRASIADGPGLEALKYARQIIRAQEGG
jgi:flagellar protein FlbT